MQVKSERRSNVERTEATRSALLDAARVLFVERGFAGTGTPEIVHAAGVTRGALYHHFADKRALFAALVEREAASVAAAIDAHAPAGLDPVQALVDGSAAFLRAMQEPGRCRLLLIDGPAVLGRDEIDRIDRQNGAAALREGLQEALAAGAIMPLPLDALANLLSALFDRAALAVEGGGSVADQMTVIAAILRGLAPAGKV